MRYIRTKDGIYDTTKGLFTPSIKMFAIGTKTIYENDIISQSDTIKELCDGFVYINKDNEPRYHKKHNVDIHYDYKYVNQIYGAIWTDKGLIYVAKMNEKGELELI